MPRVGLRGEVGHPQLRVSDRRLMGRGLVPPPGRGLGMFKKWPEKVENSEWDSLRPGSRLLQSPTRVTPGRRPGVAPVVSESEVTGGSDSRLIPRHRDYAAFPWRPAPRRTRTIP